MYRNRIAPWLLSLSLLLGVVTSSSPAAAAAPGTWQNDVLVGPSEVVFTLQLGCANPGFVCDLIDGYLEQDTSTLTGSGTFQLYPQLAELQVDSDSIQDVGAGPEPAYLTMAGTDVSFPVIPLAGVPEITDVLVFGVTDPIISVPGLDLLVPGDYPFSETISYAGLGTVFGDLEFILGPAIGVPPQDVVVSGIFRVLGDIDFDGNVEYEIVGMTGSLSVQNVTTISGETVDVDITADLTANLSGETAAPPPPLVPVAGPAGIGLMVALQVAVAFRTMRRR